MRARAESAIAGALNLWLTRQRHNVNVLFLHCLQFLRFDTQRAQNGRRDLLV